MSVLVDKDKFGALECRIHFSIILLVMFSLARWSFFNAIQFFCLRAGKVSGQGILCPKSQLMLDGRKKA